MVSSIATVFPPSTPSQHPQPIIIIAIIMSPITEPHIIMIVKCFSKVFVIPPPALPPDEPFGAGGGFRFSIQSIGHFCSAI